MDLARGQRKRMDTFYNHLETVWISSTRARTTTAEERDAPPIPHSFANHSFASLRSCLGAAIC